MKLEAGEYDVKRLSNGQLTLGQYAKQVFTAPFSKGINAINPLFTAPVEILMGRTLYPDITHPRTIKDVDDYIASIFSVVPEYRAIRNKPGPSYLSNWPRFFVYSRNVDEAAYFYILDKVREYQENVLDKHFDGFATTKRGQALRYLKTAIRYKDKANIKRYMKEYRQAGGTDKGLAQSLNSMHPLAGLSKDEQAKFLKWLSREDRQYLKRADKYYRKTYSSMAGK